jgi:hypothetical protein
MRTGWKPTALTMGVRREGIMKKTFGRRTLRKKARTPIALA